MRIRKLTPTECYKLMGFTEEDSKKASDAGNKQHTALQTSR